MRGKGEGVQGGQMSGVSFNKDTNYIGAKLHPYDLI